MPPTYSLRRACLQPYSHACTPPPPQVGAGYGPQPHGRPLNQTAGLPTSPGSSVPSPSGQAHGHLPPLAEPPSGPRFYLPGDTAGMSFKTTVVAAGGAEGGAQVVSGADGTRLGRLAASAAAAMPPSPAADGATRSSALLNSDSVQEREGEQEGPGASWAAMRPGSTAGS